MFETPRSSRMQAMKEVFKLHLNRADLGKSSLSTSALCFTGRVLLVVASGEGGSSLSWHNLHYLLLSSPAA